MRCSTLGFARIVFRAFTVGLLVLGSQSMSWAADGTWTNTSGGDYNTAGNWQGNTIASGAGFTANFNTLDIASDLEVTLNQPLTIGELIFGDTNLGSGGSWAITTTSLESAVLTLDNGGAKPVITVNELTPLGFDDTFIGNNIAGTMGFEKAGAGILTLGSGTTNTITGGIDVTGGTLRLQSAVPGQNISITNGATIETGVSLDANTGHTIMIPSGQEGSITTTATVELGNFSAAGATLNLHIAASGATLTADGDWAIGGSPAAVNVSSEDGTGFFRLRPNSGSPNFNTGTAFADSHLHLDNVTVWTRTNSGGNDVNIGALSGTETAVIAGGAQGGGTAARYIIGALNTDTEFAGSFDSFFDLPDPENSMDIIKVGTGTLTLSGTVNNVPRANGTSADGAPWRRGGNTQIQAGTIALVGDTFIAGGATETVGDLYSTIDVQAAGTLDVTGYTNGTYATQQLQRIVGTGNIVGDWNHADGLIEPGNTLPALGNNTVTTADTIAAAGTLTFNGDLELSGGDIGYDMTLNPNSGNDLIHVTGAVSITGAGSIIPNPLEGVPNSGTYTVLMADGGITSDGGMFTVDLPGRGSDPTAYVDGNSLKFDAVPGGGSASLVWTGANGGVWDIETTQSWSNGGSPDVFFDLDSVTLDNTASNKTVNMGAFVSPTSVTIDSNSDYTFTGTGGIIGSTGLVKNGTGNLIFQVGNTFSGDAVINDGDLDLGDNGNALGTGQLVLNSDTTITVNAAGGLGNSGVTLADGTSTTIHVIAGNPDAGGAFGIPDVSGGGNLTLQSELENKFFSVDFVDFTGNVTLAPTGTATTTGARLNGDQANLSNSVVNVTGAALSNRQGGTGTDNIQFGELHGDAASSLTAFVGGSTSPPNTNWQIGALGTDSDFAGIIQDGTGGGGATSQSMVTKVGAGTLTLTGANTYTGDTVIEEGTLSINSPYLADTSNVFIADGAFFNLNFAGTDDINFLYLGGDPVAPGMYGSANSMGRITGTGMLNVLFEGPPLGVDGDYNDDGVVNAADYVVWRNNEGTTNVLPNDPNGGTIGQAQYDLWVANFGQTAGPGAASGSQAVPEPASGALLIMLVGGLLFRRMR